MSSQQMHEDNRNPQYTEGYNARTDFEPGDQLNDQFTQKVYPQIHPAQRVTAKQRMVVAIVSVSILVPLAAILLTTNISDETAGNPFIIFSRLIMLVVICLTIMIVNIALGWKRS
ncbi:MAG: hypothetical protein H0V70_02275 [Ktedonobacteraceae bacterium]|nr:hypothetical protein [Ktedonobacteraceae bacterium]